MERERRQVDADRLVPDYHKELPPLKGWRPSPKLPLIIIAFSLFVMAVGAVAICIIIDDPHGMS